MRLIAVLLLVVNVIVFLHFSTKDYVDVGNGVNRDASISVNEPSMVLWSEYLRQPFEISDDLETQAVTVCYLYGPNVNIVRGADSALERWLLQHQVEWQPQQSTERKLRLFQIVPKAKESQLSLSDLLQKLPEHEIERLGVGGYNLRANQGGQVVYGEFTQQAQARQALAIYHEYGVEVSLIEVVAMLGNAHDMHWIQFQLSRDLQDSFLDWTKENTAHETQNRLFRVPC